MSGSGDLPTPFRPSGDGGPGGRGGATARVAPPTPTPLHPPSAGAAFPRAPGGGPGEPRPEPFDPPSPAGEGGGQPAPGDPPEGFAGAAGRGGARSWSRTRRRRRLRPAHVAAALGVALLLGLVSALYHYRDLLVATFIRAPAGVVLRPARAGPEAAAPETGGAEARAPAGQRGAGPVASALPGSGGEGGGTAPPAAGTRLAGTAPGSTWRAIEAPAPDGAAPPGLFGGAWEPDFVAPAQETPRAGAGPAPGGAAGAEGSGGWPESAAAVPGGPHDAGSPAGRAPVAWGERGGAALDREAEAERARVVIRRRPARERVDAGLREAYVALQAGDLPAARRAYDALLRERPGHRDALLGRAALALREGRSEDAIRHYLEVLRRDPRDGAALAALVSLDEDADPARSVSLLRGLLRESPDAAHLSFSLGSVFARERRWAEARQAFLDAHRKERGNPDYAYNLAVSLDHLSRREGALAWYRLALDLAEEGSASFDAGAVRGRIRAIGEGAGS